MLKAGAEHQEAAVFRAGAAFQVAAVFKAGAAYLSIGSFFTLPPALKIHQKTTIFLHYSTINQLLNPRFSSDPHCSEPVWTPTFSNEKSTIHPFSIFLKSPNVQHDAQTLFGSSAPMVQAAPLSTLPQVRDAHTTTFGT